ncbi:MAG: hypothetical protein FIA91_05135 [Geobacter sp.]|nr:hypothetical protein [Geobacter sp.]
MGRYLHRRAIAGIVPDLVTWKQDKGMGPPHEETKHMPQLDLDSLHPALAETIDLEKLRYQLNSLETPGSKPEHSQLLSHRSIRTVKQLDDWMKHQLCEENL